MTFGFILTMFSGFQTDLLLNASALKSSLSHSGGQDQPCTAPNEPVNPQSQINVQSSISSASEFILEVLWFDKIGPTANPNPEL